MVVLMCLWMFVLGIIVGRNTAPVKLHARDIDKELAELKKNHLEKEINEVKADVEFHEALKEDSSVNSPLSDPDLSANPDEPANPARNRPLPEKVPLWTKKNSVKKSRSPVERPKNREPATGNANVQQPTKQPESPPGKSGKLTIQVASFKDPKAAQKKVEELLKKGYNAYRSPGIIPGKGVWHRVRIGYFNKRIDAKETIKKLKKDKIKGYLANRSK